MPKIALGSMFRNSTGYLPRYFSQVEKLRRELQEFKYDLQLILAEGDSGDATWNELHRYVNETRLDAIVLKRQHNGTHQWGSVDNPERWKALSWVCNGILDHIGPDIIAFIYVESDLVWKPMTMLRLLQQLNTEHPAIAPMCFTAANDFYDIWGHIKDGVNFSPFPPYHEKLGPGLTEVDSVGSCIAMLGYVARSGVRFHVEDHFRGLGRDIRSKGYSLWVDPMLRVVHY